MNCDCDANNVLCSICGNQNNNKIYKVKEMLIGLGDVFDYLECGECGCLHILNHPYDLSKYYPKDYYSFIPIDKDNTKVPTSQKILFDLRAKSIRCMYTKKGGILSRIISWKLPHLLSPLKPESGIFDKKILDIGCGHGDLLKTLATAGFNNLYGIDPFIEKEIIYNLPNGKNITIYKKEIFELDDTFDIIMLNHSLEHMPEQEVVLRRVCEMLNESGKCIIRIPTVSSYSWQKYRECWFALDAPRHLYLHSLKSIATLAESSGFKVSDYAFDSILGEFYSRAYQKGWNLERTLKFLYSPLGFPFLTRTILQAIYMNRKGVGDSICVYLEKIRSE